MINIYISKCKKCNMYICIYMYRNISKDNRLCRNNITKEFFISKTRRKKKKTNEKIYI